VNDEQHRKLSKSAGGLGEHPPENAKDTQPKKTPIGSGNVAVVTLRMEDITHWVIGRISKMPREHKFALGDKLLEACLQVTCMLVEATYIRDKSMLLSRASRGLVRARVLARLANRSSVLSNEQLAYFDSETVAIGRMIGGWTRHVSQR
jgi:hypothetical protein